jgi:hypothetical protein
MLRQLDEQIRDAFQHADDCARRAKSIRTRQEREDWLLLKSRYLILAQNLQLSQRVELNAQEASLNAPNSRRRLKDLNARLVIGKDL